jgi:Flp pilus assembly pilin Flp
MKSEMTSTAIATRNARLRRLSAEGGQTPTEYLMIVGIMAAVILFAFVVFFWPQVKAAAQNWSGNAAAAVNSSNNAGANTIK